VRSETWTSDECAELWGVKTGTWLGYVSRGQAPAALADPDEHGRRRWNAEEVRTFPRPGAGRTRAATSPEAQQLLSRMDDIAERIEELRSELRTLVLEGKADGLEVRAMARASRVSPQTVYGWLSAD
jgi:transposase